MRLRLTCTSTAHSGYRYKATYLVLSVWAYQCALDFFFPELFQPTRTALCDFDCTCWHKGYCHNLAATPALFFIAVAASQGDCSAVGSLPAGRGVSAPAPVRQCLEQGLPSR